MTPLLLVLALAGAQTNDDQPNADAPVLMLPVDGPAAAAAAMETELARALRSRIGSGAVVTQGELSVALSAERTKDVLGCDDVSCLNDILGALGGRWAIGVTLVEGLPLSNVTVILRDLEDAARAFRIERRAPSLEPARLRGLADDLAKALAASAGWNTALVEDTAALPDSRSSGASTSELGGTLRLTSLPTGADVELNGKKIGQAPLTLSGLSAGEYRLRLFSKGYKDDRRLLELGAGTEQSISVDMNELRDWEGAVFFGVAPRTATLIAADGTIDEGTVAMLSGGLFYEREIWGPIQVGGIAGYNYVDVSSGTAGSVQGASASFHGAVFGGSISIGECICLTDLAKMASTSADTAEKREAAKEFLENSGNSTWALAHGRLRAKLLYHTPTFVTAELGIEIGMLGVLGFDIFYSGMITNPDLDGDNVRVAQIGRHTAGVRIMIGYSSFFPGTP